MREPPLMFRHDLDEARRRALGKAMAELADKAADVPLERMRSWLSDVAHGEFDALGLDPLPR